MEKKNLQLSKVAIVGRPNVGKSSLYNRLIGKRISIIDSNPGVTRDYQHYQISYKDSQFIIMDTGGITSDRKEDQFANLIESKSNEAITQSNFIIFIIDQSGLTKDDYIIADLLRKIDKPIITVVNKCDNVILDSASSIAYELNLGEVFSISAIHGRGINNLLERIYQFVNKISISNNLIEKNINIAIIGKPNVGKSMLLNKILGEQRSLVSDIPGTTRDSIEENINFGPYNLLFIDTAGMRRKTRVRENIEYYSVNRAVQSIDKADVIVHLIDSLEHISDQDKKIIGIGINHGKAIIIGINKWDLMNESLYEEYVSKIRFKFAVSSYIPVISLSAKTGLRVKNLLRKIIKIYKQYSFKVSTTKLNIVLQDLQSRHNFSNKNGALKIYYGTQISVSPPKFLLFVNRKELFNKNYQSYLINQFRKIFGFKGVPIIIYIRKSGE